MSTLYDEMFKAWTSLAHMEEELLDHVLLAVGADPEKVETWPFDDTSWDWYDRSVELYGVKPGWSITEDQMRVIAITDFTMVYVNYTDDTERVYWMREGEFFEGAVTASRGPRNPRSQERQSLLQRRIDQIREAMDKNDACHMNHHRYASCACWHALRIAMGQLTMQDGKVIHVDRTLKRVFSAPTK